MYNEICPIYETKYIWSLELASTHMLPVKSRSNRGSSSSSYLLYFNGVLLFLLVVTFIQTSISDDSRANNAMIDTSTPRNFGRAMQEFARAPQEPPALQPQPGLSRGPFRKVVVLGERNR